MDASNRAGAHSVLWVCSVGGLASSEADGRCVWAAWADWPVETFEYYPDGQIHTRTDPCGVVTHYEYYSASAGAGLKEVIADANGLDITTAYTYDSVGRPITLTDPLGNTTQNQYHASGLLRKTTAPSPLSYETSYEYYEDGRLKYVKQQVGQQTIYLQAITYNNRGQKATVRGPYPENSTQSQLQVNYTQYAYDALGRLDKVTDAEGNVTETRYYPDGKVWRAIDAEDHNAVANTYNTDGSLKEVRDAKGNVTKYEYNGFMGLKKTIYPDDTYEEPTYDIYRRLIQKRTRGGQKTQFAYDGLNRVKTKTVRNADETVFNTINYAYDLVSRLLETTDNTGTTAHTYDDAGRLAQYQYDAAGQRTLLTYPDAYAVVYAYDELGRPTDVYDGPTASTLAEYSYDARSRRTGLDYANGAYVDYIYDTASRLLSIDNQTGSGQYEYAYTYDYVGDRMTMAVTDGGGTKTHVYGYGYDDIYQLTDVNYPAGYDYLATDTTFNYDPAGNRTTVIDDGGIMVYASNDLNQCTAVADVNYLYDDNGNLTNDGVNTYTYDPENRLLTVAKISDPLAAACDNAALTFTTGGSAAWFAQTTEYYYDNDAAQSGDIADSQETWLETTIEGEGTLVFWWKVSSENNKDWLEFRLDGDLQDRISGNVNWQQKSYAVTGAGSHTLKWRYVKDSSASDGSDCGWYIGTREGRRSLLLDKLATRSSKPASTQRRLYGEDAAEALLHKGLGCLRRAKADLQRDRKGTKWKVILACWIRQQTSISNRWLAEHVHLGAATGVSRLLQNERRQPLQKDPLWRKLKKC